ncbi:hypothetical protein [Siminovitchia sp. FSL W7-1587]|uniref:hypothetical protein n=1 Tax=Siminovitchia sp. FSL W7-1587 TaxID=2954699 RepID=UPI0030D4B274
METSASFIHDPHQKVAMVPKEQYYRDLLKTIWFKVLDAYALSTKMSNSTECKKKRS